MHGLLTALASRHPVTAVALVDEEFSLDECRRAMEAYCSRVVLLPNPRGRDGRYKRGLQLRSLLSRRSFERLRVEVPGLQATLDGLLGARRFDAVVLEFPYLGHLSLRRSPPGTRPPRVVLDAHEIAYDMVRQFSRTGGPFRRVYAGLDWRKLRREELAAFRSVDGVVVCSAEDRRRVQEQVPGVRTAVVPNAADVAYFQPRSSDPPPDGHTVLFFGLLSTLPNSEGVQWFVREVWPRVLERRPDARLKILGRGAPPSVQALAGPSVEVVGFAEDLRPHLAAAAAVVVPLRLGGGTRLKIVEGMAMGKAIVSTTLGAEGLEVESGRELLLADAPADFAEAVLGLLGSPETARRLGAAARARAVERYAWSTAAAELERFLVEDSPVQEAR